MVLVNFKITMGAEESASAQLRAFAALFDGRASATFVILEASGALSVQHGTLRAEYLQRAAKHKPVPGA